MTTSAVLRSGSRILREEGEDQIVELASDAAHAPRWRFALRRCWAIT
ncbi:MAG: hypothetical protein U0166_25930 [Acidobacteriota bacterium]